MGPGPILVEPAIGPVGKGVRKVDLGGAKAVKARSLCLA